MKNKTVSLKINNCLDCPKHTEFQDPSSDDSWDFHDVSVACTLTKHKQSVDRWNPNGFRIIAGPDRFARREDAKVP